MALERSVAACMRCFVATVTLFSIVVVADDQCNKTLSNTVDSLSTMITSSCGAGSVTWENPHGSQAITFLRNTSFTLCLSSNSASSHAAVYRLIGPSRRLLVPKSHDGMLGCYDSQCSHVSLLIESQNSSGHVELMYQISMANRCPSCTESCQITCLCTAPYVFTGEVALSTSEDGQFTHSMRIIRVIKNDGMLHGGPRPGLVLCCAENEVDYAISYLQDLLETDKCCS
ncbi:hypothetical protein EMCRGX_G028619 [Ephydatia muelleri]